VDALTFEGWLATAALAAAFLLAIAVIALSASVRRLRRALSNMTAGAEGETLERVLTGIQSNLAAANGELEAHGRRLTRLEERMARTKGHVALHRYNAFGAGGVGSDLSFSLAIVDDEKNGAVITAIHGRDETFVYGKPVTGGRSDYKLTPEEQEAIDRAVGKGGA